MLIHATPTVAPVLQVDICDEMRTGVASLVEPGGTDRRFGLVNLASWKSRLAGG